MSKRGGGGGEIDDEIGVSSYAGEEEEQNTFKLHMTFYCFFTHEYFKNIETIFFFPLDSVYIYS